MRNAFDTKFVVFEVEKQSGLELGDIQVAEHLRDVTVVERRDNLGVDDEPLLHDEVGNEDSDELAAVVDVVGFLLLTPNPLLTEFDDKRTEPVEIAKVVYTALRATKPRSRYQIGYLSGLVAALEYLPQSWVDYIMARRSRDPQNP